MERRVKKVIEGISAQKSEDVSEIVNFKSDHTVTVKDSHIKQDSIWIKLLEYFCSKSY